MAAQAGADLLGAEKRRLLDRTFEELQEMCRHPCDNLDCDERLKFGDVTDNARVRCGFVCLQKKKVVADFLKQTPRQIFEINRQNIQSGKKSKILHISIQCDSCGEEGAVVRLQDTVEKLYLDLRQYLANDKAQPLLYRPGQPNEDMPDDAKAVCELTHRPCVDDFAKNYLTSEALQSILQSLQPEHELYRKLRAKGVKAQEKFGDKTMTYIRIGLGLLELGQYTAVLELWPKGYKSPKHHHGGCAGSVRVLHGALNCQLFDSILDDEPIKFKGDDGQLGLPNEEQSTLKLTTGDTTWLNRQNWWVHQVQCHDDFDFALSVHLYKSCSDAFAFMKPTGALTKVEGGGALEKGMPNNDYFWNISLSASDERVKEIGRPAEHDQSAGPLDFEKHVLFEVPGRADGGPRQAPPHQRDVPAHWAAMKGHKEELQLLHELAPETLSFKDNGGRVPAHWAAMYGHTETLQLLHELAPETLSFKDNEGGVPAHLAAMKGHKESLQLLHELAPETLSFKDNEGGVPAHWAAMNGNKEALQLLHELAPETLSFKDNEGGVPAHRAAMKGHKESLQLLHELAPETLSFKDNEGGVPAHRAAMKGHKESLQLLHELAPETLSFEDNEGGVPAHWAAMYGHTETLQLLHDLAPETLSFKDNLGGVPAHWAAMYGVGHTETETLQLLHELAPETLSFKDNGGRVPAHWAAMYGHTETLQLLHDLAPETLSFKDGLVAARCGLQ
ncbi:ANKRD44 [Symbiodinium sp. CCMP2592]|nr:ANKRD44 [Symbiodinium sp. CCMP2592]